MQKLLTYAIRLALVILVPVLVLVLYVSNYEKFDDFFSLFTKRTVKELPKPTEEHRKCISNTDCEIAEQGCCGGPAVNTNFTKLYSKSYDHKDCYSIGCHYLGPAICHHNLCMLKDNKLACDPTYEECTHLRINLPNHIGALIKLNNKAVEVSKNADGVYFSGLLPKNSKVNIYIYSLGIKRADPKLSGQILEYNESISLDSPHVYLEPKIIEIFTAFLNISVSNFSKNLELRINGRQVLEDFNPLLKYPILANQEILIELINKKTKKIRSKIINAKPHETLEISF